VAVAHHGNKSRASRPDSTYFLRGNPPERRACSSDSSQKVTNPSQHCTDAPSFHSWILAGGLLFSTSPAGRIQNPRRSPREPRRNATRLSGALRWAGSSAHWFSARSRGTAIAQAPYCLFNFIGFEDPLSEDGAWWPSRPWCPRHPVPENFGPIRFTKNQRGSPNAAEAPAPRGIRPTTTLKSSSHVAKYRQLCGPVVRVQTSARSTR